MEKEKNIPELKDLIRITLDKGSSSERWEWRIKGNSPPKVHHPYERAVQWKDGDWAWCWMNKIHRWDGPASSWQGETQYWIHGEQLSKDEWERHPQRLEWLRNKIGTL